MVKVRNFNEGLEESLAKVGREVLRQREMPQVKELPEREIVKESIRTLAERAAVEAVGKDKSSVKPAEEVSFLPAYIQKGSVPPEAEAEISGLIETVWSEGLEKAFASARKHPAFVEDAFHDALTDKLLPELKKRGILKRH